MMKSLLRTPTLATPPAVAGKLRRNPKTITSNGKYIEKDYICNRQKRDKMNKVILNIPENINLKTFDFSVYVASKMYEDGLVSAGQASEMVGISKRAFIEILGKYGVSLFSQSVEDLDKDIANA